MFPQGRGKRKDKDYFEGRSGICILSSADNSGKVTSAVYSAPRVMEESTVCLIMRERLTYHNVLANPHTACMYIEQGAGYLSEWLIR